MKKIRNFNLRLHYKDIRQRARRKFDLNKLGLDDANLLKLLREVEGKLEPAVIYESFGADHEETAKLAPVPGLAHTLGLATLGPKLGSFIVETREISSARGDLLELVAASALKQSVNFVASLLKGELEAEQCELSPIEYLDNPDAVRAVYDKLDGPKILLELRGGELSPDYSQAFCLSWMAKRRGKKKKTPKASIGRKSL